MIHGSLYDDYFDEEEVDYSETPERSADPEGAVGALQDDPALLQAFSGGELVTDSVLRRVDEGPAAEVRSAERSGPAVEVFVADSGELAGHPFGCRFLFFLAERI